MILLDEETKAHAYDPWLDRTFAGRLPLNTEAQLRNAIKLLEAEIEHLRSEVAYLRGFRDAMRG